MKLALVTGGCGFLGSRVVKALRARGVSVRVLALPDEPTDNLAGVEVELVRGNVLDVAAVSQALRGSDTLFHVAAVYKDWMPDPTPMYEVNLRGTFNMLEAARRASLEKVVYTASIVSLGRPEPGELADENTRYNAWDIDFPYSRSKYHSREIAESFASWGLDVRVVCPGLVVGPGDIVPTPSGNLIINTVKGKAPLYCEGGTSYVDVRDAAEVHVLAAERGKAGERYVATAHNLSTKDFLLAVQRAVGKPERAIRLPVALVRSAIRAMEAQARRSGKPPLLTRSFFEYSLVPSYFSNAKSLRELGAEYRPFEDTLADAITYFKQRGRLR